MPTRAKTWNCPTHWPAAGMALRIATLRHRRARICAAAVLDHGTYSNERRAATAALATLLAVHRHLVQCRRRHRRARRRRTIWRRQCTKPSGIVVGKWRYRPQPRWAGWDQFCQVSPCFVDDDRVNRHGCRVSARDSGHMSVCATNWSSSARSGIGDSSGRGRVLGS